MKIFRSTLSGASLALLIVQLGLIATVAARYLYQRWTSPRVWTRAYGDDPKLILRGRYLSLKLEVSGCQSTLPSAKQAVFPRDYNGAVKPGQFTIQSAMEFPADLEVESNRLVAIRIQDPEKERYGQNIDAWPGKSCGEMTLLAPVDYYVAEHARDLVPLKAGQELWMEVTVPPRGAPRPLQLALKENGVWKPLKY